jgi:hypothetical protein
MGEGVTTPRWVEAGWWAIAVHRSPWRMAKPLFIILSTTTQFQIFRDQIIQNLNLTIK